MAAAAVVSAAAAAAAWVVAMAPFILIGAVVTAIVYEVITHWKQISTTAEQVWHDVTNFVGHMASDIGNFLGEAVKFFISLPADILGVYADADTWLYDVGKNIIEGLINGVKDMVGDLTGAVKNVASGAIDTVKNILGIHSPSSVFAEIGTNIGQGLVQGVQGTKSTVAGALTSLTNVTLAPPTVSGGGAAVGGGGGAAGAGVVIESGGSLVTVQYNGRGQFTIQDAAAMGKEIILAMRAQGLATTNMNNMASLR
jgi:phage-related minor tail protein